MLNLGSDKKGRYKMKPTEGKMDYLCEKCTKDCKQHFCVVAYCPNYAPKSRQDAPNFNDRFSGVKVCLNLKKLNTGQM